MSLALVARHAAALRSALGAHAAAAYLRRGLVHGSPHPSAQFHALQAGVISAQSPALRGASPAQAARASRWLAPQEKSRGFGAAATPTGEQEKGKGRKEGDGDGDGKKRFPRPGHPYGWIDAEAEGLIARAYKRHRAMANTGASFPPSLSTADLEAIGKPTHYPPQDLSDRLAFGLMRFLRRFVHAFFREKYDHHAVTLETVAAIPGHVAAFHRHLRSLRRMDRDHGWIGPLLEEAENERMHLLIWLQVCKPTPLERIVVVAAQLMYTAFYTSLYLLHPRSCHRLTGYLEEEAHAAYTDYLKCIDNGKIKNRPAPQIAIDYYHLPKDADLRDVVLHVRADEAAHREFNHMLADKYKAGDLGSRPADMKFEKRPEDLARDQLNGDHSRYHRE